MAQGGPVNVTELEASPMGTIWQRSQDLPQGTAIPKKL